MTQEEIYKKAISTYGVESQRRMAIEEMSELTNALMKFDRGRCTIEDIIDEIADVVVMMKQLSIIYGESLVNHRIEFKTQRLKRRLEER